MKEKMINLIKSAFKDESKIAKIETIYELYDNLQYCAKLGEMANVLVDWLFHIYKIENVSFSLFNLEKETTTSIFKKGKDFYLDGEFSFYFIINTHTDLNAVVSFCVESQKKYDYIAKERDIIDAAFLQITPILQNGIIKKHHVEASSVDSVTNVYNRKYLIDHIHKIISLTNNTEDNISFLMVGIDRFKAVIEEFDYDVGDKVLVELAKVIHRNIKDFDIVARLTGDEFLVALVNLKDNEEAQNVAKNIIKEFSQVEIIVNETTKQTLQKTICVGISSFPADSEDINQVLKNADNFLYEAKNKGRGKFAIYQEEDNSSIDLF